MITVRLRSGEILDRDEIKYHHDVDIANAVVDLVASDVELERIKSQFTNIPMTRNDICKWFGDDAKFIVANINWK